jgi:SAM-dependent methyltransferase
MSVPLPRIDFGVAAGDYVRHRQGPPAELFDRLARQFGIGVRGQDVVDLGTGTGVVARELAARGARAVGVDPSPSMLAEAARLAVADGLEVTWRHARAEETGLAGASADVVTSCQAWHWFDRPRAAAEARRVLRPGGAIAILNFDWLSLPGSVVALTLSLVDHHRAGAPPLFRDGELCHNGVYPYWADDLAAAGFTAIEHLGFDITQRYTHDAWRGRMRSAALVHTMPPAAQAAFDEDHARALAMGFPDPVEVPHRVFAVVARAPGAQIDSCSVTPMSSSTASPS